MGVEAYTFFKTEDGVSQINEKTIGKDQYTMLLQQIAAFMFAGSVREKIEMPEVGRLDVTLNNGRTYCVHIHQYSLDAYAVRYFNYPNLYIKKDIVDAVFKFIRQNVASIDYLR
jgi:hypothetical protein